MSNQFAQLATLAPGSIIKMTDGKQGKFVHLETKRFIVLVDDKTYNYPVYMYAELVQGAPPENTSAYKTLRDGELFVADCGDDKALLFAFQETIGASIHAINPINQLGIRLPVSWFVCRVSDLETKS